MRHTEMQRNVEWFLAFAAACEKRAETPEDMTVAMWLERSAMATLTSMNIEWAALQDSWEAATSRHKIRAPAP